MTADGVVVEVVDDVVVTAVVEVDDELVVEVVGELVDDDVDGGDVEVVTDETVG